MTKTQDLNLNLVQRFPDPLRYSIYKLDFNPFPVTPVVFGENVLPPLNDYIRNQLEDFVNNTYNERRFGALVITGDYGSGKSHLLRYLQFQINSQLGYGSERSMALLLSNPDLNSQSIVREIFRKIGKPNFTKYLWHTFFTEIGVLQLQQSHSSTQKFGDLRSKVIRILGQPERAVNYREFLENLIEQQDSENFKKELEDVVTTVLIDYFPNERFVKELYLLMRSDDERESLYSWQTLNGDNPNENSKFFGILSSQKQFAGILRVLRKTGYAHIYLLIDEFADIPLSKTKDPVFDLDSIVEKNVDYFSIAIALPEQAWMWLKAYHSSFSRRFRTIVKLPTLSRVDAETVIKDYLNNARKNKHGHPTPFTTDSIRYINQAVGGNIRELLRVCYELIEYGANEQMKSIDRDLVIQVFQMWQKDA
jgi:hypothetical protein